ncbi:MAG: APC family permease [Propionibacteriaceae bacterium]|nr:APC family permease [Propionibacteriaceae bacterium]
MERKTKKFRLIEAILSLICVVFVVEAAAPAAAIGNTQYFWWIFLIIAFLLPYGMVVSELGTTYEDEGGLYDWVKRAFGNKWGSRVAFYYWVNFPLWMAALGVMFPTFINIVFGVELGFVTSTVIALAFIWLCTLASFSRGSDAKWILNLAAIIKALVALSLFGIGIWFVTQNGFANQATSVRDYFPDLTDLQSLTFLSIILFNFMGFEVLAAFTKDMRNPRREIPKAIVFGGLAIAVIYLMSAFGIGAAVPVGELSLDSGIVDALLIMLSNGSILIPIIAVAVLLTFFGNIISWSYGINYVTSYAAKDGNMPRVFAIESKKTGMPIGASLTNAVVASILVIIIPLFESFVADGGYFWVFFAVSIVFLLIAYIPMFPAFLKLRRTDAEAPRPFSVPGKKVMLRITAIVPAVLLVLGIIASVVPLPSPYFDADDWAGELEYKIPMLVAFIGILIVCEITRVIVSRRTKSDDGAVVAEVEAEVSA